MPLVRFRTRSRSPSLLPQYTDVWSPSRSCAPTSRSKKPSLIFASETEVGSSEPQPTNVANRSVPVRKP